jgi:hypothetical protein
LGSMRVLTLLAFATLLVTCGGAEVEAGSEESPFGLHVGDEVKSSRDDRWYVVTAVGSDWIEWSCLDLPPCGRWGPDGELLPDRNRVARSDLELGRVACQHGYPVRTPMHAQWPATRSSPGSSRRRR